MNSNFSYDMIHSLEAPAIANECIHRNKRKIKQAILLQNDHTKNGSGFAYNLV